MRAKDQAPRLRWLVPEVVQTSAMDCGPASLKSLLEGFGVSVGYGRLREACQTDVDGTSIDALEEVANRLGLAAEQIMVPVDHVLLPQARTLPALAVIRLPNGVTHFVVVWRQWGPWVQVMDPGTGRHWRARQRFLADLYIHTLPVPAAAWRAWAGSADFLAPLRHRLAGLGLAPAGVEALLESALADSGWQSLAVLDAAARMVAAIIRSGGLKRGRQGAMALERFIKQAQQRQPDQPPAIPAAYWSVQPAGPDTDGDEQLLLRGAVLVRAQHRLSLSGQPESEPGIDPSLAPELVAALQEAPSRPERELLRFLREDGLLAPLGLLLALLLAAGSVVVEALLFRGLLDLGRLVGGGMRGVEITGAIVLFVIGLLFVQSQVMTGALRLGRGLETRLRIAFLAKIPRLHDRYFQSRLMSDMAERSHSVHVLRNVPYLGAQFIQLVFTLMLTTLAIAWLSPASAFLAGLSAMLAVGLPLAAQVFLIERDLRVRTHLGALGRFYLDALLGLVPIRAHSAERAVRREHERLLVDWVRARFGLLRAQLWVEGLQAVSGFGLAAWLLFQHLAGEAGTSGVLLLVYWALQLPGLGQEIALLAWRYPTLRNITLRLLEPLGAPEANVETESQAEIGQPSSAAKGVTLSLKAVHVRAAGQTILEEINLTIEPGSHVAVVGPSGAGKSSLVGLLLGWHRPANGQILVDGAPLTEQYLRRLRPQTAWVDPAIHLWNRSLLDNLRYGQEDSMLPTGPVIEQADLLKLLATLPEGLQQSLGEGGALASGGEGQRVRLGRAMLRPQPRLVILDEPFRGLDRDQRRTLLARARRHWQEATLICITHDVSETQGFERVLVIEAGRIVEDGAPADLAGQPDSRYQALLRAEAAVWEEIWGDKAWRRLRIENGRLEEEPNTQLRAETNGVYPGKRLDKPSPLVITDSFREFPALNLHNGA